MFCSKCGANLPGGAFHCTMCGAAQNPVQRPIPVVEDDWDKTQRVRSAPQQNPNPAPQPVAPAWNTVPQPAAPAWNEAPAEPAAPAWNEAPQQDWNPQPQQDWNPQPQQDWNPQPQQDWNPQPQQDWNPQPQQDWNPQPQQDWNPQPQQDWNPQPQQDWNPQPQYQSAPRKKTALPIMITGILSVVLIVFSALAPLTMAITDIPVLSAVGDAKDELETSLEELRQTVDDNRDDMEMAKEELTDEQREAVENAEEKLEAALDNCSIMNVNALADALLELEDELAGYQNEIVEDFASEVETLKEMKETVVNTIIGVCIGAFVLPLLFAILAFALKKTSLTVVALILTAISQAILSGALYIVLSAVVYIVQIILCNKYKAA